jgi:DnaA family protein
MRQLPLPVRLRASSVFDSFFAGPNAAVLNQLLTLRPGSRPIVSWLYGPLSAGKTHLLQAVCARATTHSHSAAYFPLREVVAHDPDLLSGCEGLSFVCLDDVDAIAGNAAWERAVFRLHTLLDDHGGQLLVVAASPPAGVPMALKDLASRLAAGTVMRLHPLSDDEQASALALRARQLGLDLPVDTAQYLLRRLPRDMNSLCDALDRLDQASLATQRRLTVPFVRDVLDGIQR